MSALRQDVPVSFASLQQIKLLMSSLQQGMLLIRLAHFCQLTLQVEYAAPATL